MYRLIDINEDFDNFNLNAFRLLLISYLQLVFSFTTELLRFSRFSADSSPVVSLYLSLVVARGVYPFPFPSTPAPAARVTRRRLGRNQGPQRVRSIMVRLNFKHTALLEKDNGGSITCIVLLCNIDRTQGS